MVMDEDIKEQWRSYFYKLFNAKQTTSIDTANLTTRKEYQNFSFYHWIWEANVKKAQKNMNNEKTMGPKNISIEA